MIFNKTVFKKLLKEAYKGAGLLVANKDGHIILEGRWWVMKMEERVFSNAGRAALVELTGSIPASGECYRATVAGNQMEMPSEFIEIDNKTMYVTLTSSEPMKKTKLIVEGMSGGLVRYYKTGNRVVSVNEVISSLLENGDSTEYDEGDCVRGPYMGTDEKILYWYSNYCSLAAGILDMEKDEYKELENGLSKLDLPISN